jgi:hypothetical protein
MGVTVDTDIVCGCDKENEYVNNVIQISKMIYGNKIDYLFRCKKCGKLITIKVLICYSDVFSGLRLR